MTTLFEIIHVLDDYETVIQTDLTRGEALGFVEDRVMPGLFTGRRFEQRALHHYVSTDARATVKIRPIKDRKESG